MMLKRIRKALFGEPLPVKPDQVQSRARVVPSNFGVGLSDRVLVSNSVRLLWPAGAFNSSPIVILTSHTPSAAFAVSSIDTEGCTISCRVLGRDGYEPGLGSCTVVAWAADGLVSPGYWACPCGASGVCADPGVAQAALMEHALTGGCSAVAL